MNINNAVESVSTIIIEDDKNYRETLKAVLDGQKSVQTEGVFNTAEEALDYFKAGGVPRVVLLDIELPGMSGIELLPKIKSISPNTLVIILTVFDDEDKIFNAICHGANGYLLKSTDVDGIVKAIYEIDHGGAPMSPAIAVKVLKMFSDFSAEDESQNVYDLSSREIEVLERFVKGMTKNEIAEELFISCSTVNTHIKNIYSKLHVHNQVEAVYKAMNENLV